MDYHPTSTRPYPSSLPSGPASSLLGLMSAPPRNNSNAYDQPTRPPQLSSHTYVDDIGRKPIVPQEPTWIASSPSQNARFHPSPLPSPPPTPPLSSSRAWNDSKRRKLAHGPHNVSAPSPSHSKDALASPARALACLSLDFYANYNTTSLDSSSSSFTRTRSNDKAALSNLMASPNASPASSPRTPSRSDTPLSSSSDVSPIPSPSSPPSSPNLKKNRIEIRHKGKQLKSRCTCCHVCRTSLKNYPRPHLDCSACNAVVCQPCIEFRLSGPSWETVSKETNWLCPSCLGTCVCQRCTARPFEIASKSTSNQKRKSENSTKKRSNSDADARQQRLEELLEYHRERDKFIQQIQNVLAIVKRDQREIEYQIAALQNQGEEEEEEEQQQ